MKFTRNQTEPVTKKWPSCGERRHPAGTWAPCAPGLRPSLPILLILATLLLVRPAAAVQTAPASQSQSAALAALQKRVEVLEHEVQQLKQQLQQRQGTAAAAPVSSSPAPAAPAPAAAPAPPSPANALLPSGTTLNVLLDGYYSWNLNRPLNRTNQLRSFDQTNNGFSLSQAALVLERAPDLAAGRRFGARLDLQFGQAAEFLQGNSANEPRPQVYRNIYQAYGTYIVPLGNGLTVDFGKWASSLGEEGVYSKDQINSSRSFLYTFLPAYHEGLRATYPVTPWLSLSGWLVNGINQTEDFNGFKSEAIALVLQPSTKLSWTLNYYTGQEQPQIPSSTGPGVAADGREHIADTYVTWTPNSRTTLSTEWDYVITRPFSRSAPQHLFGSAAYFRYQLTPRWALGTRGEYVADPDGLFTTTAQDLKEVTATLDFKPADGFMLRSEWRRDFTNRPFFQTRTPGLLAGQQTTLSGSVLWWFGEKKGAW